jgi:hypothetical protein
LTKNPKNGLQKNPKKPENGTLGLKRWQKRALFDPKAFLTKTGRVLGFLPKSAKNTFFDVFS